MIMIMTTLLHLGVIMIMITITVLLKDAIMIMIAVTVIGTQFWKMGLMAPSAGF